VIALLGLIVHEARHSEGYAHTCETDDLTLTELGGWAVHYYYSVFVSQYTLPADFLGPQVAASAAATASTLLANNFCALRMPTPTILAPPATATALPSPTATDVDMAVPSFPLRRRRFPRLRCRHTPPAT
jgi:hypothetical protein